MTWRHVGTATLSAFIFLSGMHALADTDPIESLRGMSLEDLTRMEITSVSKRPAPLSTAAASIYVITNEDIRRSGAQTLPEALRLAPNLEVARVTSSSYAISARGFGTYESAIRLLAMIDGRSIYTPLYGGVFWGRDEPLLEDIDRIEVISGPGGTLWGANAFNGVINVITKKAADTQGGLARLGLGDPDRNAALRYGGTLGDNAAFRVYGNGYDRGRSFTATGNSAGDGYDGGQAGFRSDWEGEKDALTLQGDVYTQDLGGRAAGRNLLGRWRKTLEGGGSVEVQAYYDALDILVSNVVVKSDTYDIQGQHSFAIGDDHRIVWGGGHRHHRDKYFNDSSPGLWPISDNVEISNLFAQDDYRLAPSLTLTLGTKLEYSGYTGLEFMPNIRLGWEMTDRHFLWSAVSRAVRTPTRVEHDTSNAAVARAGDAIRSEELIAYELGYRGRPTDRTSLSATLFYHDYDDLRVFERLPNGQYTYANKMEGHFYGLETWGEYQVAPWWRLKAGYTFLRKKLSLAPGVVTTVYDWHAGNDPEHHGQLSSQFDLTDDLQLDLALRAVDDLPNPHVPAYVQGDVRLGWRPVETLDVSLSGLNLLHGRNPESQGYAARREFERTYMLTVRARF